MTTNAPPDPDLLADLAVRATAAFRDVQERVFSGDPAANAKLAVEVIETVVVDGTPTLVLITPWTINGLIFPTGPGPDELVVADTRRTVFRGDVAPLGVYWSVNLVADVSRLSSPRQARALAESVADPFRDAVRGWLVEGGA